MHEVIYLGYYNPRLCIGFSTWREVYQLQPLRRLYPEVYKGRLVYRARGSTQRIPYAQIKKGLLKKSLSINEEVPDWFSGYREA